MMDRWTTCMVVACLLAFAGPSQGAFFDGGGDGTNWNDEVNWTGDVIPLTGNPTDNVIDIRSHQPAGSNDVLIILDAATADTFFQDGVYNNQGNFFNTRSSTTNRDMTIYLDWGNGYTNAGTWWGSQSSETGTITMVQTGGSLQLNSVLYMGRNSPRGQSVSYDVQGGTCRIGQPLIGARSDSRADITLRVSGGTFDNRDTVGTRRFSIGGYDGGTATLEISSNAVVKLHDYRGDNSQAEAAAGTGGSTYFRVIGSDATISFSSNFNTDQDGKSNLVNQIEWIADAGGVSPIRGFQTNDTFRPRSSTTVLVDLTDYAGTDDLILAEYGRYDGKLLGEVTIIDPLNRGYQFVMDNAGEFTDSQPTLSLHTYLTIPTLTALRVEGGIATMTYSAPTDTNVVYKLEMSDDLTDPGAWAPTGAELVGTGGELVFTDNADSPAEAYRVVE